MEHSELETPEKSDQPCACPSSSSWPFGPHSFKLKGRPRGVGIFDDLLDMESTTATTGTRKETDPTGSGKQKVSRWMGYVTFSLPA